MLKELIISTGEHILMPLDTLVNRSNILLILSFNRKLYFGRVMHSIDKKNTVKQLVYITDFVFQKAHSKLGFILMLYIIRHTVLLTLNNIAMHPACFRNSLNKTITKQTLLLMLTCDLPTAIL